MFFLCVAPLPAPHRPQLRAAHLVGRPGVRFEYHPRRMGVYDIVAVFFFVVVFFMVVFFVFIFPRGSISCSF